MQRAPVPSAASPFASPGVLRGAPQRKIGPDDFLYGTLLGEGAYARVLHCRLKAAAATTAGRDDPSGPTSTSPALGAAATAAAATPTPGAVRPPRALDFAVKIMEKRHIKKEGKVSEPDAREQIMRARDLAARAHWRRPGVLAAAHRIVAGCITASSLPCARPPLPPPPIPFRASPTTEPKTHFVMMERGVLSRAVHPCIVRLCYTFQVRLRVSNHWSGFRLPNTAYFAAGGHGGHGTARSAALDGPAMCNTSVLRSFAQDAEYLYIVLELCRGGELSRVVRHYATIAAATAMAAAPASDVSPAGLAAVDTAHTVAATPSPMSPPPVPVSTAADAPPPVPAEPLSAGSASAHRPRADPPRPGRPLLDVAGPGGCCPLPVAQFYLAQVRSRS